MDIEVTVDGSCSFWSRMSVGCVIREAFTEKILLMDHADIVGHGTNNLAEAHALLVGCRLAEKFLPGKVILYTDSQLIFRQLKGDYAVRDARLRGLHRLLTQRLRGLKATVRWHPREEGDGPLADKLASYRYKEVLDEAHNRNQSGGAGGANPGGPSATGSPCEAGEGVADLAVERGSCGGSDSGSRSRTAA